MIKVRLIVDLDNIGGEAEISRADNKCPTGEMVVDAYTMLLQKILEQKAVRRENHPDINLNWDKDWEIHED